ncbi:MAG: hypothetical protein ACOZIN_14270 [Myxococcota bacterium]
MSKQGLRLAPLLFLSAVLHLGLLWLLAGRASPASTSPVPPPVEVELVHLEPKAQAPPAPRTPTAAKREGKGKGKGRGKNTPLTPTLSQGERELPLASDEPRADPGPRAQAGIAVPHIDLDAPWLGRAEAPPPTVSRRPGSSLHAPASASSPQELVAQTVSEAVARHKVEVGNVPGYFMQMKSLLVVAWDIDRVVKRRSSAGKSTGGSTRVFRLVQDRAGYLVRIDLVSRSEDAEVDAEALSDLQRVSDSFPPPTEDAIGEREYLASLWELAYVPPPAIPPLEFDVVDLFDKKAIPPRSTKKLRLLTFQ